MIAKISIPDRSAPNLVATNVKTIIDKVSQHSPGDRILYVTIADWVGLSPSTDRTKILRYVMKARRVLERDFGYFLVTERGIGYHILPYGAAWRDMDGQVQRAKKQITKAVVRTNLIPVDKITDGQERAETVEHCTRMNTIYGFFAPKEEVKRIGG